MQAQNRKGTIGMDTVIVQRYEEAVTRLMTAFDTLERLEREYIAQPTQALAIEMHHARLAVSRARLMVRRCEGPVQVALSEVEA